MKILLEICVSSIASALAAEEGGADRIELCAALGVDGLTPSYGAIMEVKRRLSIPVHVIIRPREGDFIYTPDEVQVMCKDISVARDLGVEGVVSGALDPLGNINRAVTEQLINAARGMSFTFHRAFDVCRDPFEAIRVLAELGIDTLLTSGQATTAYEGRGLIKELVDWTQPKGITVMPGGGVKATNITALMKETGAKAVHLSARKKMDGGYDQTDIFEVKACRKEIK